MQILAIFAYFTGQAYTFHTICALYKLSRVLLNTMIFRKVHFTDIINLFEQKNTKKWGNMPILTRFWIFEVLSIKFFKNSVC